MPHLVKKGFLTTCLTTDSFGTHGNSGVKRCGEYAETNRNYRKWPETYRKNLVQPFGSRRPGVRVPALRPNFAEKPPKQAVFLHFKFDFCGFGDCCFAAVSVVEQRSGDE